MDMWGNDDFNLKFSLDGWPTCLMLGCKMCLIWESKNLKLQNQNENQFCIVILYFTCQTILMKRGDQLSTLIV